MTMVAVAACRLPWIRFKIRRVMKAIDGSLVRNIGQIMQKYSLRQRLPQFKNRPSIAELLKNALTLPRPDKHRHRMSPAGIGHFTMVASRRHRLRAIELFVAIIPPQDVA
jgi:hypothetical protein